MPKHTRTGLILLAIAVMGYLVVVRGQMKVFSERALKVKTLSEEVNSYDQRLADISEINKQGSAVQETLKAMYLAMPQSSQIPEALVMIEALASSAGVVLSTATVGTPSDSELPLTLGFGGDMTAVTKFLDALNNNIRSSKIKNQTISSDGSGNLTVTLQLGLVYQGGNL
ncbi:MAG: type 4a pilus biogenesis protein PilO [Patescibacteria group bacterium]